MRGLCSFRTWAILSLIWVAAMAFAGYQTWPRMPLDISAGDPGTIAAFNQALVRHAITYGLLAVVVPLATYVLGRMACGMPRRSRSS